MNKHYAYESINTKDGSFNFHKDNILNYQLCFSRESKDFYEKKGIKYVEQDKDELKTVKRFEKKYNATCKWQEIKCGEHKWYGYVISYN